MILGIIGNGAEKFTPETERKAREIIRSWIDRPDPNLTAVCSGDSPMGGIDVWAEEEAKRAGLATIIHSPRIHAWGAPGGYKDRNLEIAKSSDMVLVIVVEDYPEGFTGRRFKDCYHCFDARPKHVKSGACWTALRAMEMGKEARWEIIR